MDEIRSVNIGGLRFSDEPDGRSSTGEVWWFLAEIAVVGLEARTRVSLADHPEEKPLAPFFYDLAKDWRGWKGKRVWSAYEGGLRLSCSHDGLGHILIVTELREAYSRTWEVRVDLVVEAGQLDAIARDVERFFETSSRRRLP
jgi:hypothetical protein